MHHAASRGEHGSAAAACTHLVCKLVAGKQEHGADLLKDGQHLLTRLEEGIRLRARAAHRASAGGGRNGVSTASWSARRPRPCLSSPASVPTFRLRHQAWSPDAAPVVTGDTQQPTHLLHRVGKGGGVDGVGGAVQRQEGPRHARKPVLLVPRHAGCLLTAHGRPGLLGARACTKTAAGGSGWAVAGASCRPGLRFSVPRLDPERGKRLPPAQAVGAQVKGTLCTLAGGPPLLPWLAA